MDSLFTELTLVLIGAGVIAYFMHFLKQPSIIAYIIVGLIIGPLGFANFHNGEILKGLSEIGITLLLFMVGLDLDIGQLKRIGKAAIFAGLGQIVFTSLFGFILIHLLGITSWAAGYIAIALTFSSTIIVVKLLSEKKDLNSLYGKLAIGIFLMQDVAAIFILIFLSALTQTGQSSHFGDLSTTGQIVITIAKAFILGTIVIWLTKFVFPKIIKTVQKSDELVLLFALAWSLGLAMVFSLPIIGFNAAIGGFVAGLALANTGVHYQMSGRIKPIRDFFIIIFFIVLGSQLMFNNIGQAIIPAVVLTLFVLIGNPLIVMIILGLMGYKPRVSFMTGVTVAQISEFSLILMSIGLIGGYVTDIHVTIVTLVGIATIALSSYGILYAEKIFNWLHPILWVFDFHKTTNEKLLDKKPLTGHVVVIGIHRLGSHILDAIHLHKNKLLLIDFNPDLVEHFKHDGYEAVCGDITDPFIQELANLNKADMIISTVPSFADNMTILEFVKRNRTRIKLILVAEDEEDARTLYAKGADYVLLQHFVGGMHLADLVGQDHTVTSLAKIKKKHLHALDKLGHKHKII